MTTQKAKARGTRRTSAAAKKADLHPEVVVVESPPRPAEAPPFADFGAWKFHEGEDGWTGHKVFEAGLIRDVAGKTEKDVRACAREVDQIVKQRTDGLARQAGERAEVIREHADRVEAGLI